MPTKPTIFPGAVVEAGHHLGNTYGATGTFFVPGDVPLITGDEVDTAIQSHVDVTILPDRNDVGTKGLLSSPPNAFQYLFEGKASSRINAKPPRPAINREFSVYQVLVSTSIRSANLTHFTTRSRYR
ncbi:MAG: hypothetical protein Ct9H300mP8_00740 [Gammaproteobacteria bacterium]|nr:MAG: hypothetical protein Ct9H300mP8_00740 [Gammaproteobacteria bacterium]